MAERLVEQSQPNAPTPVAASGISATAAASAACASQGARPDAVAWAGEPDLASIRAEAPGTNRVILSRARGSRGEAVRLVQEALLASACERASANSLPRFGVDGIFGTETHNAVRLFQATEGLETDGAVGPLTLGRLDAFVASAAPTPGPSPAPGPNKPQPAPAVTAPESVVPPIAFMAGQFKGPPTAKVEVPIGFTQPEPVLRVGINFPTVVGGVTGRKQGWVFHAQNILSTQHQFFRTGPRGPKSCTFTAGPGLDNDYPYARESGFVDPAEVARYSGNAFLLRSFTVEDNPVSLLPATQTPAEGDRYLLRTQQRFRMFMVWDVNPTATPPTATAARPIPLGFVDWGWQFQGNFLFSLGAWRLLGQSGSTTGGGTMNRSSNALLLGPVITNAALDQQHSSQCP